MEPWEFQALKVKAETSSGHTGAVELLQFMRTHKVHQPEIVLVHGGELISKHSRKLGGELWTVMEQVFIAACIAGHTGWRDYCMGKLTKQWPNSHRVERLKGIQAESDDNYDKAKEIYGKILKDKPEDTMTRKRQIAMYKQRGHIDKAIEEINKYLDTFSTDTEVWHELAELYIEAGGAYLARAQYCFEELMLANPRSMYHILTYAELLYTLKEYDLSRKYFSLACYLDGGCPRALWGLYAVNMVLFEKDKDKQSEKHIQTQTFCIQRLQKLYKGVGSHGKVASALLKENPAPAKS